MSPSLVAANSSSLLPLGGRARLRPAPCYRCEVRHGLATSSRRGGGNSKKGPPNGAKSNALANEDLVARLIRSSTPAASPDSLMVRLVVDEGPDRPSTVQLVSLSEAIRLSIDRMVDLIGISLETDPPVVRAAELAKLEYKSEQAKKRQQQQTLANRKEKKTFRFKAGIGVADLDRKIGQLKEYLQKGHECEYTVFTRARTMRENHDAGIELVEHIQQLLRETGTLKKEPETNETKSFYRVVMEPKKSS